MTRHASSATVPLQIRLEDRHGCIASDERVTFYFSDALPWNSPPQVCPQGAASAAPPVHRGTRGVAFYAG